MEAGQMAYEGYRTYSDCRSPVTGVWLPEWHEQTEDIRAAWRAAADAVVMWMQTGGAD